LEKDAPVWDRYNILSLGNELRQFTSITSRNNDAFLWHPICGH
jgi:hypothetical protein